MTKRQSSYVYAAKNVLNVLMQNVAIYAFISVLVALRDRIQGRLDLIETIAQEQERSRRGIGMDKTRIRGLLTNTLVVVCGQMRSWANQTNQNDLAEQAPASRSHWARVSHLKLGEKANVILKLARTHLDKLTGYGMTPELLNELESRIATYNAIALAPRHAITHRKTLTGLLAGELDGLRNDLENVLAPLMNQFEEIAPAFFQDYKNARLLVTPATTPIEVIRERAATKAKKKPEAAAA
jgi:hypothetical protein